MAKHVLGDRPTYLFTNTRALDVNTCHLYKWLTDMQIDQFIRHQEMLVVYGFISHAMTATIAV